MTQSNSSRHDLPQITEGMSAADYVMQATQLHESKIEKGWGSRTLYPTMRWIGDAMLAVAPINRLFSAIGLTLGLGAGANTARLLAGRQFDGKATEVPNGLTKPLHGVMGFDPVDNDGVTKLKKFAMYAIFSIGGYIGMTAGTRLAYHSTYQKNRHPEFLEDYIARTAQEQGDRWTPLAAFSAIFGSSSGFAFLPIPGLNYALGLSSRTVLMQNRNNMTPGVHKWASGTPTPSTYGLREGLGNLVKYAVNNPSETPAELELKSFHLLGQLFPDVKAEHIQKFVEKIHHIRDPYLEEGGVPAAHKKELEAKLNYEFTKAGFERTLLEIGLNPRSIVLKEMNGAIGRMGNRMGANSKIDALQQEYLQKLETRCPGLPENGHFLESPERYVQAAEEKKIPLCIPNTGGHKHAAHEEVAKEEEKPHAGKAAPEENRPEPNESRYAQEGLKKGRALAAQYESFGEKINATPDAAHIGMN